MHIISNSIILKKFQKIDIFKLDLGRTLIPKGEEQIRVLDEFIKIFEQKNHRFIHKFGSIGSLKFYQDVLMDRDIFHVYDGDDIYEINFEETEDIKEYLSNILFEIENKNKKDKELQEVIEKTFGKKWYDSDDKNRGKSYEIDQTLSKEEYLAEMIKRRELKNKINS